MFFPWKVIKFLFSISYFYFTRYDKCLQTRKVEIFLLVYNKKDRNTLFLLKQLDKEHDISKVAKLEMSVCWILYKFASSSLFT